MIVSIAGTKLISHYFLQHLIPQPCLSHIDSNMNSWEYTHLCYYYFMFVVFIISIVKS